VKYLILVILVVGASSLTLAQQTLLNHELVFVEGGTFQMGLNSQMVDEPVHVVTLSSFNIGKYEVTQAQWKAVMGINPSHFKDCEQCPVENVSWNDVQEFIRKLNILTGKNYRLPTEAEWEYSARGGKQGQGFVYSGSNEVDSVSWYKIISWSEDVSYQGTHVVGAKKSNELELFDMSGNVWEWCSDWYGEYSSSMQTNPSGPKSGRSRVLRGGSFDFFAFESCIPHRNGAPADFNRNDIGLRLVLPVK